MRNENLGEKQRDDRLRGFDDAVYSVDGADPGRAMVDGGATFCCFGGHLSGIFSRMPSGAGTVVLLSRLPDGRLLALREHLRGVHHRPVALPLLARSAGI